MKRTLLFVAFSFALGAVSAQHSGSGLTSQADSSQPTQTDDLSQSWVLDLQQTIRMANDSSLEAFRSKNLYLSGYWSWRTYKANRLPNLTFSATPAKYYRYFVERYDSERDMDIYRTQQYFYSAGSLVLSQNFDLTGGTFTLESDLGYTRYFGSSRYTQITTAPIMVGYSQDLLGYNAFRWDRKIEPLKYEKVKKEFLYNTEAVSESATTYFFDLASAQADYDLARDNLASTDTLYRIGQERFKIAAISRADLLTLKLDAINARNTLRNAESDLKRAMSALATFLNLGRDAHIRVILPGRPREFQISVDEALTAARANNPTLLSYRQEVLEAEQEVDRTKHESRLNASLSLSAGFNQATDRMSEAYRNLLQKEMVSLTLSFPLIDWGVSRGKYNMARSTLATTRIEAQQNQVSVEEEVVMTVSDFNTQLELVVSASEAYDLSILAYNETRQRFIIGKADMSSLTLAQNRQQEALANYIAALQEYWEQYYKIRRLTLWDFDLGFSLSDEFDYNTLLR